MSRTFIRQDVQVSSTVHTSGSFDDSVAPTLANYQTNALNLRDDLNNLRSMASYLKDQQSGNWYDTLVVPATLETGTARGVDNLNTALHAIEKKRVLRNVYNVGADILVSGSNNFTILATSELPSNTTAAVGVVTTLGTVAAAHGGSFGTHALSEVAGGNPLSPRNLAIILDATTGDPILSSTRQVYALFQTETATDGHTMTGATATRAQLSFVRPNGTFDDLEACPVADIENKTINYNTRERIRLEDFNEFDFLVGAQIDIGASAGTIDRQTAYDNQGVTPVDLTTSATLDLEAPGITWTVRDDLEAALFRIKEGSAGNTSEFEVGSEIDLFNIDSIVNDFANGVKFDTGAASTEIQVGVTANVIEATGGALDVKSGASADLRLFGSGEMLLDDGNQTGSTWAQTAGIKLSDTTAEWDNFETQFGEVSLLNAIVQASNSSQHVKVVSVLTTNVAADTDVSGPANDANLDTNLGSLAAGTFVDDYDIFLNGILLRNGANSGANHDVYPGTSLANGQLKFEFALRGTGANPDVLTVVKYT